MVKSKDWTGKEWKTNQCPKKLENYCPGPLFFYFIFLIKRMSGSLDAKYEEMGGESEQCAKHVFTKDSNMWNEGRPVRHMLHNWNMIKSWRT